MTEILKIHMENKYRMFLKYIPKQIRHKWSHHLLGKKMLLTMNYMLPIKITNVKNRLHLVESLRKWGPVSHHPDLDYATAVDQLLQTEFKALLLKVTFMSSNMEILNTHKYKSSLLTYYFYNTPESIYYSTVLRLACYIIS